MEGRRRFDPTVALAALLLAASLGPSVATLRRSPAVDFYHFWLVGPAVRAGEVLDVYAPETRTHAGERAFQRALAPGIGEAQRQAATKFRRLETTATPFLYASFTPFVTNDYDRDRIGFNVFSVLAFLFALGALTRRLGYGATGSLLLMAFTVLAFEPFASDVRVGNVNRLQFALLALYVLLLWDTGPRDRLRAGVAGTWLGLLGMWKPNVAFVAFAVVVFWGALERSVAWRAHLLGLVLGGVLGFAAAAAFFGTPLVWVWWADAALDLPHDFPIPIEHGNFAPLRALEQGLGLRLGAAWTLAWLVLLALFLRRAAAGREPSEAMSEGSILLVGIGCAVALLASPLSWLHYYLASLFLVAWVLRPDPAGRPLSWTYRGLALLAVGAVSMGPLLEMVLASAPYRWAALGNGGLVVLLFLSAGDLRAVPRRRAALKAVVAGSAS